MGEEPTLKVKRHGVHIHWPVKLGSFTHELYQNRGNDHVADHGSDDDNDNTNQETSPPLKKLKANPLCRTGRSVHF
jgi:hypothetical protein